MIPIRYVERAAYRPPVYRATQVELWFDLGFEHTLLRSRISLSRNAGQSGPLELDGRTFELVELKYNGELLGADQYRYADRVLVIDDAADQCVIEATTQLAPHTNRSQMGLFKAGSCLVTQCEADGFRRLTFFPDRPDVLAPFWVRLEGDKASFPVLLSNGDCVERGDLDGERHYCVWNDPHPKPSYVFAVVAGNLGVLQDRYLTRTGREIQLAIYAAPESIAQCDYAMGALKRALIWDETTFGLEYDLSHYNIVAVEGYTGAMENKGLNLFEAKGILADPSYSTDNDYLVLERILAHEVFHNWTGNRVTCRDWFELCLKEGLTRFRDRQFSEAMSSPGTKRIDAVGLLRRNQFPEDDGNAAHPVKPERYADVQNLYTATVYEKGAELIRMLWVLLGADVFRDGLVEYLRRYDGQAVTTEELITTLESVSGRDLKQFRGWYTQKGRPTLTIRGDYDESQRRYSLDVVQHPPPGLPAAQPMVIPVALRLFSNDVDEARGDTSEPSVLEVNQWQQRFEFTHVPRRPIPSVLRGFSAPVSWEVDLQDAELSVLMARETDAFARWNAAQQLATRVVHRIAAGDNAASAMAAYVDAFGAALEKSDDDLGLLARVLSVPDEPTLSDGLQHIDLDGHQRGRNALRAELVAQYGDRLLGAYHAHASDAPYAPEPHAIARRSFRNCCLELLLAQPNEALLDLALEQATTSDNMNDAYAALAVLVHVPGRQRSEAIELCWRRWHSVPIALGQWFTAQALSRAPDAVDRLIELTTHPSFDATLPEHGMALYGSFFRQNRVAFHEASGRGYALLADTVITLDKRRSSGSSWFMPQINQWRRFDTRRQSLMRAALERVAAEPGISRGLTENIAKALGTS